VQLVILVINIDGSDSMVLFAQKSSNVICLLYTHRHRLSHVMRDALRCMAFRRPTHSKGVDLQKGLCCTWPFQVGTSVEGWSRKRGGSM